MDVAGERSGQPVPTRRSLPCGQLRCAAGLAKQKKKQPKPQLNREILNSHVENLFKHLMRPWISELRHVDVKRIVEETANQAAKHVAYMEAKSERKQATYREAVVYEGKVKLSQYQARAQAEPLPPYLQPIAAVVAGAADNSIVSIDEHLPPGPNRNPGRGIETCGVVESMFSYSTMWTTFGDTLFADKVERIAFNALPATWASPRGGDMWSHQYFQAVNEINAVPIPGFHGLSPVYTHGINQFPCCTSITSSPPPNHFVKHRQKLIHFQRFWTLAVAPYSYLGQGLSSALVCVQCGEIRPTHPTILSKIVKNTSFSTVLDFRVGRRCIFGSRAFECNSPRPI